MARKVIIVGPKVVAEFLNDEIEDDWDIQIPCESVEIMWDRLSADEISDESEIVCIVDVLFKENPEAFVEAVAELAPEALVMVLSYGNDDKIIRTRVSEFAQEHSLPAAPFHFIRAETALPEIEKTIAKHDRKDDVDVVSIPTDDAPKEPTNEVYTASKDETTDFSSSDNEQPNGSDTVEVSSSTDN